MHCAPNNQYTNAHNKKVPMKTAWRRHRHRWCPQLVTFRPVTWVQRITCNIHIWTQPSAIIKRCTISSPANCRRSMRTPNQMHRTHRQEVLHCRPAAQKNSIRHKISMNWDKTNITFTLPIRRNWSGDCSKGTVEKFTQCFWKKIFLLKFNDFTSHFQQYFCFRFS